jgi:pimeloyl-ACP methyl ester carboxylesterase
MKILKALSTMRLVCLTCFVTGNLLSWQVGAIHSAQDRQILTLRDGSAVSSLLPPSLDTWYRPPTGWEATQPGEVLKFRTSTYNPISISNCLNTFQILYRTTDTHGNASWAVSTVFVPYLQYRCSTATPELCAHGVVSYQVAYDSVDIDSSPSYTLQLGDGSGELASVLASGWFLSVPDFEGPRASYTAGVQAGHATLDSIRAVLRVGSSFGLQPSRAKVALWGYSGGALATGFAAELAADYAPELKLAGAVIGGPTPNLTTVTRLINRQDDAGLMIASILGITTQQEEARQYIVSRLKSSGPYNATGFFSVSLMSGLQAITSFYRQDIYQYFQNGSTDLYHPIMTGVYNIDGTLGAHGTPNMPTFIYKAVNDKMSPVSETDDLVKQFCTKGANIVYHRNSVGDHTTELANGRPRALQFLRAVLDGATGGTMPVTGCSWVNVTIGGYV